jgi:hypothetical protein
MVEVWVGCGGDLEFEPPLNLFFRENIWSGWIVEMGLGGTHLAGPGGTHLVGRGGTHLAGWGGTHLSARAVGPTCQVMAGPACKGISSGPTQMDTAGPYLSYQTNRPKNQHPAGRPNRTPDCGAVHAHPSMTQFWVEDGSARTPRGRALVLP